VAQIWDRLSGLVKQTDQGPAGTFVSEALLQGTGLLDMSSLNTKQQAKVVSLLAQGKSGQAQALAAQYDKQSPTQGFDASIQTAAGKMRDLTGQTDRAKQALDDFGSSLLTWVTNLFGSNGQAHTAPKTSSTTAGGKYTIGNQAAFQSLMSGGRIGNTHGGAYARADQVQAAWAASGGDPRVFSLMLAQMSQESNFNPNARSADGGVGIAQFTDAGVGRKYLGANWRQAAMDPNKAMRGLASYDRDLLATYGGSLTRAAAAYNGDPHPNAQAQAYGNAVGGVAQHIEGSLDVTVTVKDGKGTVHDKQHHKANVKTPKGHKKHI
jgi:hypothetical protein